MEVHTFDQDDLLSEDVMILDTYTEIFVWVGQNADVEEKQQAFDIAQVSPSLGLMIYRFSEGCIFFYFSYCKSWLQKYLDHAAKLDGNPAYVPVYKVPEGSESFFFTKHF